MVTISKETAEGETSSPPNTTSSTPRGRDEGEEQASIFNRLLFLWMGPLFRRAKEHSSRNESLEAEDLLPLPTFDHGDAIYGLFQARWNQPDATLPRALLATMGPRFIIAGSIKMFNSGLQFSFPLILNEILRTIESSGTTTFTADDPWHVRYRGYWLAALLCAVMVSKAVTESAYFQRINRCAFQSRVAVSVAVYAKALRLANAERQSTTLGELVNLMQVDATKIELFVPQAHVLWDGLLQISGYMTILYTLIGWPCFAGLGLMIVTMPIQAVVVKKLFGLNRSMVQFTDDRVRTTNEALQGMQSVKMFAWEDNFSAMISDSRKDELSLLGRVAYMRGFSRAFISALPGLVAFISFLVYALVVKDDISASTLFAALIAFDQLRFPLLFYPMSLANYAQASVSAARVSKFLQMKEVTNNKIGTGVYERQSDASGVGGITLENATVYWSDPSVPLAETSDHSKNTSMDDTKHSKVSSEDPLEGTAARYPKPVLKDITLSIQSGELCAVVGRVASGKSSLASAILNEALLESGSIRLAGKVAYASQSPWILNASLRDNILFGLPYNEQRYNDVIQACQLTHDLVMLDNGDLTEIGEKGINLSGGQKQRVSVARAAYSNADTILLDDPLSALDPEVGKLLFDECIVKFLQGKTRLLITNQLQFLKFCDTVVALRKGSVIEQGKFADLAANADGEVTRLLREMGSDEGESSPSKTNGGTVAKKTDATVAVDGPGSRSAKTQDGGALVTKEERAIGAVPLSVYGNYIKSGGGFFKFSFVYIAFVLSAVVSTSVIAWISFWTSDAGYERNGRHFYLGIYCGLAVALGFTSYLATFLLVRFGVGASRNLHANLIESILRAPQSFFDTTPIGRILSRFSKDMYTIDIELAEQLDFTVMFSLSILFAIGSIMFVTPLFGVAIPPLAFIYIRTMNYFRNVSRETKRLESVSRSPVFALFSETLGGLSTIRAYGLGPGFLADFETKVNLNTRAYYNNKSADRWIAIRLETVGACIAGLAAFFATRAAIQNSSGGESSFASLAGLSLTFAISITSILNFGVRIFAQLEAAMNSCERVLYYTENIPQEAPATTAEMGTPIDNKAAPHAVALQRHDGEPAIFSDEWPTKGEIVFNNLQMKYREETPLVLKGLTVTIQPGERVGVVGRTGSGKSSLLLTLLRIVEPTLLDDKEKYQPPISIDGVDILRIGLRDLRSRVGIIPQNPVLFSGTIRSNIDPFNQYTDSEMWSALERCDLMQSIQEMAGELSAPVSEYGENLSAGMRQMLVIARALLRNCRVLLLDEATSNVDFETDQAIQKTLRNSFPGSTVLTIAHRVNTILDSDKIMVLKDGLIEEFASPTELLADENSAFSDIVRHAESEAN